MKKNYFLFTIFAFFCFLNCANAGALRQNSIKTCSDGVKYGYYVSKNVIHWHVAESCDSFSGWCPKGEELAGDPCPQSAVNTTTQQTTTRVATSKSTTTTTTIAVTSTTTTIQSITTTSSNSISNESKEENNYNEEELEQVADTIATLTTVGLISGGGYFVYKKIKK